MNRSILIASTVMALVISAAHAESKWNGAGWYQTANSYLSGIPPLIIAGPFTNEARCGDTVPPDDEIAMYFCESFDARPDWDN